MILRPYYYDDHACASYVFGCGTLGQCAVVDAPFERLEAIDAVWRAVEALSVDLKMALLLRDVVGLSYTEIADSLEITLATVKWRIYKAREDVQLALAREGITFGDEEKPKTGQAVS